MSKHTKDDIDKLHDYSIYTPARLIYIGSEQSDENMNESGTDYLMAERLIKNIEILEHINAEPITIIMNNLGGDFYHGMSVYDRIISSKCHVTIKAFGYAMSMGSLILQSADVRIMSPNATMMIHYGNAGVDTTSKNFQQWAKEFSRTDDVMESILYKKIVEKNPDFKIKEFRKMLGVDTFLQADQALALGLIDQIEGK
jgi:ATP-dependent protease ClpP protease subunit